MSVSGANVVARIGSEIDKKGLKRADLYTIVPSGTLSNWKNKGQGPNAFTLYKVAVFLNVSVDYLLTGKDSSGLTGEERQLLDSFSSLASQGDKDEIMGIISLKLERAKKGDILSSTANA
jgi:transcriptional regulator with XRE-family HTH domain